MNEAGTPNPRGDSRTQEIEWAVAGAGARREQPGDGRNANSVGHSLISEGANRYHL
jgi:hypothetical protein